MKDDQIVRGLLALISGTIRAIAAMPSYALGVLSRDELLQVGLYLIRIQMLADRGGGIFGVAVDIAPRGFTSSDRAGERLE